MLCIVLVPPCFLQREQCLSVQPFFDFFGICESMESLLHLGSAPYALSLLGGFSSSSTLLLMISRSNNRSFELTGVVLFIRSYFCCHLTGHIHNRWVARSASLSRVTGLLGGRVLKVTVQLFNMHKELPNWNPVWLL